MSTSNCPISVAMSGLDLFLGLSSLSILLALTESIFRDVKLISIVE